MRFFCPREEKRYSKKAGKDGTAMPKVFGGKGKERWPDPRSQIPTPTRRCCYKFPAGRYEITKTLHKHRYIGAAVDNGPPK